MSQTNPKFQPCYETHTPLPLAKGVLYGGSGNYPVFEEADIYVVLNHGDRSGLASDPWDKKEVIEIAHIISDGGVPKNVPRFKKLITYLCNQLQEGKKVHVGCIGGHGRTGMVLSAVVAELGTKDAIQYVRTHYCERAVENSEQVAFLKKHFGVSHAKANKEKFAPLLTSGYTEYSTLNTKPKSKYLPFIPGEYMTDSQTSGSRTIYPINGLKSIWED